MDRAIHLDIMASNTIGLLDQQKAARMGATHCCTRRKP